MASRRNEVEKSMNTVVAETRVTPDTRFFSENVIVLTLEVADDFLETTQVVELWVRPQRRDSNLRELVVDILAETRGINNGESNAHAFLVQFFASIETTDRFSNMRDSPTLTGLILMPSSR